MTESLVMVDDLAFILNVKNKTIVTAVNDTSNAVFTNIVERSLIKIAAERNETMPALNRRHDNP